mmetsp:Transcript_86963/g.251183  ORF Transcript_86963/g.251183 Transcript_86963/m.251183 type:complete len:106 (-) Transcript_86963:1472-1789(-)
MHKRVMKGKTIAIDGVFCTKNTPKKKTIWNTVYMWIRMGEMYFVKGFSGNLEGCMKNMRKRCQNWIPGIDERPMNKKTPKRTGSGICLMAFKKSRESPTSICEKK